MELNIVFLLVLFWLLGQAAEAVVNALVSIGIKLRLQSFTLGFFLLGMATSLPEFFVGINSVIERVPSLSLGHLIGASIVLLSFVVGTYAFLNKEVKTDATIKPWELVPINILILLPAILSINGTLSRLDGTFIILLFVAYLLIKFKQKNEIHNGLAQQEPLKIKRTFLNLILGVILLIVFSRFIVEEAGVIMSSIGVSPLLFGILILSIGTNLPELAITYKSRLSAKRFFAFGDILGSATMNSLIAGIVSFLQPIRIRNATEIFVGAAFLIFSVLIFDLLFLSGRRLTRREGVVLLLFYAVFLFAMVNLGFI